MLIFEEAYGKKEEDQFRLFNISGELLAENSNDPLSTQAVVVPLHLAPDGLTFRFDFSAFLSYLDRSWQSSTLSTGPSSQDSINLEEPELTVHYGGTVWRITVHSLLS